MAQFKGSGISKGEDLTSGQGALRRGRLDTEVTIFPSLPPADSQFTTGPVSESSLDNFYKAQGSLFPATHLPLSFPPLVQNQQ